MSSASWSTDDAELILVRKIKSARIAKVSVGPLVTYVTTVREQGKL